MKPIRASVAGLLVCAMLCLFVITVTANTKLTHSERAVATTTTQAEQAAPQTAVDVGLAAVSSGVITGDVITTEKIGAPQPAVVYLGNQFSNARNQHATPDCWPEPAPVPRE